MNQLKMMLYATLVVAVTAFMWGTGVPRAAADEALEHLQHPHAIRDPKTNQNLHPAEQARQKRDAAAKQRTAVRKFLREVAEGKVPASKAREKGVAK